MAGFAANPNEPIAGINVTPFVDVVLVLLVALMVTATDLAAQAIGVELPRASTGAEAPPRTLAITIDAAGSTFVNGSSVSEDGLRSAVREAHGVDPHVRAILAADGKVAHARVVRTVDILRAENVGQFALEVQPGDLR